MSESKTITAAQLLDGLPAAQPDPKPEAQGKKPIPAATVADVLPTHGANPSDVWDGTGEPQPGQLNRPGGKPFDPERHQPKLNPRNRAWMPRSSGRPSTKPAPNASPEPSSGGTPTAAPVDDEFPEVSAADFDQADSQPTEPTEANAEPAPPEGDAEMSPEAGGEVMANLLYLGTGAATGDYKRAQANGAEHKAITRTFASFLNFRGIKVVGGLAIVGTVGGYLLGPERREAVFNFVSGLFGWGDKKEPKNVTPAPAKTAPPPASPRTPEASKPHPAPHHFNSPINL